MKPNLHFFLLCRWLAALIVLAGILPGKESAQSFASGKRNFPNPFFAMDTGTKDLRHQTAQEQVEMIKHLGYAGIGLVGFEPVALTLHHLDKANLKLFNIYFLANIDPGKPSFDEKLKETLPLLRGREVMFWVALTSEKWKPSVEAGDADALRVVREIAELAGSAGLKVALYPHTSYWLERLEDAVRLARKLNRPNIGVTFNLCHWLRVDEEKNLRPLLKMAAPYLLLASINGADSGCKGCDWDRLIQTLDRGSYDVSQVLRVFKEIHFTGPIGLQGYGIGGDAHENLSRSIKAWRRLVEKTNP